MAILQAAHRVSALPFAGGDTGGPAQPAPRCFPEIPLHDSNGFPR